MKVAQWTATLVGCWALSACVAPAAPAAPRSVAPPRSAAAPPPAASSAAAAPTDAPRATPPQAQSPSPAPRPCGELGCLAFATPQAAFEFVLASAPRVLAVGEAHAQQGSPEVRSSTRRFAEQLLPLLSGRARHIVIELLVANCKQQTVQGVAEAQAPVTEHQSKSNQSEFLTLGKYAQRLGIAPQALTPECAEYDAALAAPGEDAVARLLALIAQQTRQAVAALLGEAAPDGDIIVTYGGALHNDLYPREGHERWSFGPELARATEGRYVELDLIVPEFVKDTEAWRNMPWYRAFDREHLSTETLLYRPAPGSFALIFPKTETSAASRL